MYRFRSPFRVSIRVSISALFAIAVLLRVAIPAGYMPTTTDEGWYLKYCPDGMTTEVMAALFGDAHKHHHVGHHNSTGTANTANTANTDEGTQSAEPWYAQCDLGGGLALELLSNTTTLNAQAIAATSDWLAAGGWLTSSEQWRRARSRAPPIPV